MRNLDLIAVVAGSLALSACFDDPAPETSDAGTSSASTESSGDGDGDPTTGDGDGDPATGDGDGDDTTSSGDGDGDDTTSSGDGDGDDTTTGDGDGDIPEPECGNGIVEGDEVCDEGPRPPLAEDACKPDCSGVIETRMVIKGETLSDGDFGNNPVATIDSACPVGYAAMFADGVARRATTTPWESVDPIDWPIEPYTRYINDEGEEVWITDEVALIGVRDGQHVDTTNPLGVSQSCPNNLCTFYRMVTGLKPDGTTLMANNCNGWSSSAPNLDASIDSFITGEHGTSTVDCTFDWMFIISFQQPLCVELD